MFCIHCGKEIENDSKFCCYCGKAVQSVVEINQEKNSVKNKIFAFVGFGLGITSFVLSLIPVACFYSFLFVIPGFIFSGLGKNSNKEKFAKKGKLFSTLGLIFGIVMTILTIVLFVLLIEYADATYETIYDEWYF